MSLKVLYVFSSFQGVESLSEETVLLEVVEFDIQKRVGAVSLIAL